MFKIDREFVLFAVSFAILITILIYAPYELRLIGIKILEVVNENNEELETIINNSILNFTNKVSNVTDFKINGTHIIVENGTAYPINLTAAASVS
jgi:hypothetical protein